MWQCQLQHVGAGVYRLLNHILLMDVLDGWFTPTRNPLTLLRIQPFRGYLHMTHSSKCCSDSCTIEKSLKNSLVYYSRVYITYALASCQLGQLANLHSYAVGIELT